MLLNSIFLHDQQFPGKRVEMLKFSEAKERDLKKKADFSHKAPQYQLPKLSSFSYISVPLQLFLDTSMC